MDLSTQIVLGIVLGLVLAALLRAWSRRSEAPPTAPPSLRVPPPPAEGASPPAEDDLRELLRQGRTIEAVKAHRERHRVGLKEAKEAIERLPEYRKPGVSVAGLLVALALASLALGPCFFSPRLVAEVSGSHRAAVAALRECPAARAVLGEPIEAAWLGANGFQIHGCGTGSRADAVMSVAGSERRGRLQFQARQRGEHWQLQSAMLWSGERAIPVPAGCGQAPPPAPSPRAATMPAPTGAPAPAAAPAPPPAAAAASPGPSPACERLARCCEVAGDRVPMRGMCGSLPGVRDTIAAEAVCGPLLDAAPRLLATDGPVPEACR